MTLYPLFLININMSVLNGMEMALRELLNGGLLDEGSVAAYVNLRTAVDVRPPSTTALHILAGANVVGAWKANMAQLLIDAGADASILDIKGAPAVYKAIGSLIR